MSVLLGCMSFGMRSLMAPDKEIQGWYYLLGEEIGRKNHLKVPMQQIYHKTGLSLYLSLGRKVGQLGERGIMRGIWRANEGKTERCGGCIRQRPQRLRGKLLQQTPKRLHPSRILHRNLSRSC
ncbi:hypothetical protein Q8A73_019684 [Channa argus]|nr:hypothetical protein Q8A73_019684 [Channa argus]